MGYGVGSYARSLRGRSVWPVVIIPEVEEVLLADELHYGGLLFFGLSQFLGALFVRIVEIPLLLGNLLIELRPIRDDLPEGVHAGVFQVRTDKRIRLEYVLVGLVDGTVNGLHLGYGTFVFGIEPEVGYGVIDLQKRVYPLCLRLLEHRISRGGHRGLLYGLRQFVIQPFKLPDHYCLLVIVGENVRIEFLKGFRCRYSVLFRRGFVGGYLIESTELDGGLRAFLRHARIEAAHPLQRFRILVDGLLRFEHRSDPIPYLVTEHGKGSNDGQKNGIPP